MVDVAHPVSELSADGLRARLAATLRRTSPPVLAADGAVDALRLRVAVQPRSATELRGFWLPFSGTYAIGVVRLALERPVIVTETDRPATAIVWQDDRTIAVPWRAAAEAVARAADDLLDALLRERDAP